MSYGLILGIIPLLIVLGLILLIIRSGGDLNLKTICGAIICTVLVVSVVIPLVEQVSSSEYDWKYDDYVPANRATDAYGALEIITVAGVDYLHAKDVGPGGYTLNGTNIEIEVSKAPLDVFMGIGQSNTAYYKYNPAEATPVSELGTTYYYGTSSNPIKVGSHNAMVAGEYDTTFASYAMYDMVQSPDSAKIGNIDEPFAANWYKLTGHKCYYINTAVPGTYIQFFAVGESQYNFAKMVFSHAMDCVDLDHYEVQIQSYIFIQDWTTSADTLESYVQLVKEMNASILGQSSEKFNDKYSFKMGIIATSPRAQGPLAYDAIQAIPANIPTMHIATTVAESFTYSNGLMLSDSVHFSQKGDNLVGLELSEWYYRNR